MKLKLTLRKTKPMMALVTGSLMMMQTVAASVKPPHFSFNEEEKPAKKTKTKVKDKNRSFSSLNNLSVKIYPDALKREMHVVAKDNDGKEIDFFVFDLQGTLKHNYKMQPKDHQKISGLARGTYVYRVFCGDEETAAGQFEIR
ncbi:MAG: hypothetical protein ACT4OJ_16140 [Bacteroidota bacterium]